MERKMKIVLSGLLFLVCLQMITAIPVSASASNLTLFAVVTNQFANKASIVDLSVSPPVLKTSIDVGSQPNGIELTPDGKKALVSSVNDGTLSVIDLAVDPPVVSATIKVGTNLAGLAISPDGTIAIVCDSYQYSNNISILDLRVDPPTVKYKVGVGLNVSGIYGTRPYDVGITLDGKYAIIAVGGRDVASVIDLAASPAKEIYTIKIGKFPIAVGMDPTGKVAVIPTIGDNSLSIIDLTTSPFSLKATVPVGRNPGSKPDVSADGKFAVVGNSDDDTVSIVDLQQSPPRSVATLVVGDDPRGVAIIDKDNIALVANRGSNTITQIDLKSLTVIGSFSGGSSPSKIAVGNILPTTTSITITSSPVSGENFVKVDGVTVTTPATFTWAPGDTHNVEAISPVADPIDPTGTQYVWTSWSDSGAQTHNIVTPSTATTYTANYKTQYYITVTSAHDSPTSSAWVDKGSDFTASVTSPADIVANDHQWVCTGYKVDGGSLTSGTSYTFPSVSAAHTLVFEWKEQFWIQVNSAYDSPTASQWVDQGGSLTVSVTSPASDDGMGTRYRCTGYTLDSNSPLTDGSTSYTFNDVQSDHTTTFNWIAQYRLIVSSAHDSPNPSGTNWYDTGIEITASVTSPVDESGGTRYRCTGWTGAGSAPPSGTGASVTFSIIAPSSIAWNWIAQFKLTVASDHDSPSPSVGDHWYDTGTHILASVTSPADQVGGTRWRCTGFTGTGSAPSESGTSTSFNIEAPSTLTWNWIAQYYLAVNTNPTGLDAPTGEDWYDSGATAHVSTAQYASIVPLTSRYRFDSWTGASGDYSDATVAMDSAKTATANYVVQYYLTLTTSPPNVNTPSGEGWYDSGTYASISTAQYVDIVSSSSRYRFNGWTTGDMSEITDSSATSTTVKTDKAKTVTANYVKQLKLTTASDPAEVGVKYVTVSPSSGDGFYDSDTTVILKADSPVAIDAGSRYRFDHWFGDASGTSTSTSVTVNTTKTVIAHYLLQYLVTFSQSGLDTSAAGTVVTVDSSAKTNGDLPFNIWADKGTSVSYTYEAVVSSGVSGKCFRLDSLTGPASPITVTCSNTVTGNYEAQYYNTPAGTNVVFSDASTGITVTFDDVTSSGNTTVITSTIGPPPPTGFLIVGKPVYYDISTTATYSGTITVSIPYDGSKVRYEWRLRLWQMNTVWKDITFSVDKENDIIYGKTTHLSLLIITEPMEYYLTVQTEPSDVTVIPGEGWYTIDTMVTLEAPAIVPSSNGLQYKFDNWKVDGKTVSGNPISVHMDSAHTAIAAYTTQYYLTVISPYDLPSGEGWYNAGETAYATLAIGLDYVDGLAYGFAGWTGDASGWDLLSDPITMNAPKTAVANWESSPVYGDVRTIGFWKHQVNVWYFTELVKTGMNIRGIGTAQISEDVLIAYLSFIDSNSDYFRGKIVKDNNGDGTITSLEILQNAYNILRTPTGPDSMKRRAEQQLLAVWLNLAYKAFFWNTQLSQETIYIYYQYNFENDYGLITIGEAIKYVEAELVKTSSNLEAAKDICESINNRQGIIWGT